MSSDIDVNLTISINTGAGHLPPIDFIMIWISQPDVPLLVVAVARQWRVLQSERPTRHILVATTQLAVSRVYTAIHYVRDVLGEAVTGIIVASLVQAAYCQEAKLKNFVTDII
jgi:hypothetical protein